MIEQINGMTEPISPEDLYVHLLDTEARLAQQKAQREPKEPYSMMVNVAAHGNGGGGSKPHRGGGRGNGGGGRGNPNNPYKDHQCQVCWKLGHTALRCWKHFDKGYNGPEKMAHVATTSYTLDPAWYAASATTDHITGDLDKLSMKEHYVGQDQVHVVNGLGMIIKHVGQSIVSTPSRSIILKNILHVPQSTHNLAYVHCLTSDNGVFLDLHPNFFYQGSVHEAHASSRGM
jgi:hypothetical protein